MGLFTKVRNAFESAAVVVGNYYYPGSSLVTSKIVSNDSKKQLGSPVGIAAQVGSGAAGLGVGSSYTGIPASETGGKMAGAISGMFAGSPAPTSMAEMPGDTPIMADQSASTPIYDSMGNIVGGTLNVLGAGAQAAGKLATSSVNAMAANAPAPLSGTYRGPSGYTIDPSMPFMVGPSNTDGQPVVVNSIPGNSTPSNFSAKDILVPGLLLLGAFALKG